MFDGLRRGVARALRATAGAIAPAYPSTGTGKRTAGLRRLSGAGPNAVVGGNVNLLRQQSRHAARWNWAAGRAVDLAVTHVIGTGMKPQSLCPDPAFRAAAQTLFFDWTGVADADGALDFYGLQALMVQEWFEGGECFARLRARRPGDGLPVPLQLQLIEPEQCPIEHTTVHNGNPVLQGIERDSIRRRAAYWMYREHPGEWVPDAFDPAGLVRVPAEDMLHLYHPTRAGQLRGVPQLSRMLVALQDIGEYDDAERVRKKVAAMKMGAITRRPGEEEDTPLIGEGLADAGGVADVGMEPGTFVVLDDGEDVKWFDPADVGGNYEAFLRWQYRGVAASANLLYEELTGDYEKMNDRVWRAAFNTFKRRARFWQHNLVAVQVCEPVWRRFIDMALIAGALTRPAGMPDRDLYRVAWTPDRWEYIHPVQDVQAIRDEIAAKLTSRARAVSERGEDVEDVDRQIADDLARERRLGMSGIEPPEGAPRYRVAPGSGADDKVASMMAAGNPFRDPDTGKFTWGPSKKKIKAFAHAAMADRNAKETLVLFGVTNSKAVMDATGLDFARFRYTLGKDEVRKVMKDHGDAKREAARGQLAVLASDFKRLPSVLTRPDSITRGGQTRYRKLDAVVYEKTIGRIRYTVVVEAQRKRRNAAVHTLWKRAAS